MRDRLLDLADLKREVQKLHDKAAADYQDAAAMHAMGKVSSAGGARSALKAVLELFPS